MVNILRFGWRPALGDGFAIAGVDPLVSLRGLFNGIFATGIDSMKGAVSEMGITTGRKLAHIFSEPSYGLYIRMISAPRNSVMSPCNWPGAPILWGRRSRVLFHRRVLEQHILYEIRMELKNLIFVKEMPLYHFISYRRYSIYGPPLYGIQSIRTGQEFLLPLRR